VQYEISSDGEVEKVAVITIPKQNLDRSIDTRLVELQKNLSIKGFRKGKVPKDIIRARYYDTLKGEALNDMVNESFWKVLQDRSWLPASRAELKDLKEDDDIIVTLRFEVIPDFKVQKYKEIELYKEKSIPEEMLLEKAMEQLKDHYAAVKEVTRPAAVDDIVTMDITIKEGEKVKQRDADVVMKIGDRSFPDEVNRILVGAKAKEQKEVTVDALTYLLVINKIEERILPTIDDAFAHSHQFKDLEELRQKVLQDAKTLEKQREDEELKEKLSRILLERTTFVAPPSMVTVEYKKMLQRMNIEDNESNRERFWDTAEKRTRLNLILDWIARAEEISVTNDDVEQLTKAMGINVTKENKPDIEQYIKAMLTREKTLDFVFTHARISEKSRILTPKEAKNDTHTVRH
jgi:trigger factor